MDMELEPDNSDFRPFILHFTITVGACLGFVAIVYLTVVVT